MYLVDLTSTFLAVETNFSELVSYVYCLMYIVLWC